MKDKVTRQKPIATSPKAGALLRRIAEEVIEDDVRELRQQLLLLSPEAVQQALHELRVHQIELEMQNQELRHTQAKIEDAKERYFDCPTPYPDERTL